MKEKIIDALKVIGIFIGSLIFGFILIGLSSIGSRKESIINKGHHSILRDYASSSYSKVSCETNECKEYNLLIDNPGKNIQKIKELINNLPQESVEIKDSSPGPFVIILATILFGFILYLRVFQKESGPSKESLRIIASERDSLLNDKIKLMSKNEELILKNENLKSQSDKINTYKKDLTLKDDELSQLKQENLNLNTKLDEIESYNDVLINQNKEILDKYSPIINIEKAVQELTDSKKFLTRETNTLKEIKDELDLFQVGFYSFRYDFNESSQYADAMELLKIKEKNLLKEGALIWNDGKIFHGLSDKESLRLTKNIEKLAMMAFSGEVDSLLTKVKYNNVDSCIDKVSSIAKSIEKLLEEYNINFRVKFLNLKEEEISLVHEYQELIQKEREEQKLIREQMKEEEKALREAKRAEEEAEREEKSYEKALEKARIEMESQKEENQAQFLDKIKELENKLVAAQLEKQRAKSQAELTKQGHVYIISNIGSFGENIYKIGMTRRLEPMDRIWELGDASVPFDFDVHAMIHSENAPELENKLHRHFSERRVNKVNDKKEFFKVSLEEIANACKKLHEKEDLKIAMVAEAKEYKQSILKMDKIK